MTADAATPALPAVEACHSLTLAMLDAAAAADWAAVETLDEERRRWTDDLQQELHGDADLPARLTALRALVKMDARLQALAQEARQAALNDLRRVRGKAKASAEYQDLGARG